jgi:hypothetical protein
MKKLLFIALISFVGLIKADAITDAIKQTNIEDLKKELVFRVKSELTPERIAHYKELAQEITSLRHDQYILGQKLYNSAFSTITNPTATTSNVVHACISLLGIAGAIYGMCKMFNYNHDVYFNKNIINAKNELIPHFSKSTTLNWQGASIYLASLVGLIINNNVHRCRALDSIKNQYNDALTIEELLNTIK